MGGRHECNRVLPGTPRGPLSTLAKFYISATQPLTQCLIPWRRWTIALFAIFPDVTSLHDGRDARLGLWRDMKMFGLICWFQFYIYYSVSLKLTFCVHGSSHGTWTALFASAVLRGSSDAGSLSLFKAAWRMMYLYGHFLSVWHLRYQLCCCWMPKNN
jgi:hypothetical protein